MVSSNNLQVPRTHLTPTKLSTNISEHTALATTIETCWGGVVWYGGDNSFDYISTQHHTTPHHTTSHQYNVIYYHTSIELLCKGNMRLFGKWMWNGNTTRLLTYDCATQALPKSHSLHEPEKSGLMLSDWRVFPRRLDGWLAGIRGSHWVGGC